MIIGTLLAASASKKYLGFIDADNYFPGAVEEYVRAYAAGFELASSSYYKVGIAWHSKPKIARSRLFFPKYGRTPVNTNRLLNRVITYYTGYETEIVKTGNAGEHAMSMDLAMKLDYWNGYSIEPYLFINLIEKFGAIDSRPAPQIMKDHVEVFQVESHNPHLRENVGESHVDDMNYQAMQVIYHSPACPEGLKKEVLREIRQRRFVKKNGHPARPRQLPSLSSIWRKRFLRDLGQAPYARLIRQRGL